MTPLSRRRWLQSGPLAVALGWSRPALAQRPPIARTAGELPARRRAGRAGRVLVGRLDRVGCQRHQHRMGRVWRDARALGRLAAPEGHGLQATRRGGAPCAPRGPRRRARGTSTAPSACQSLSSARTTSGAGVRSRAAWPASPRPTRGGAPRPVRRHQRHARTARDVEVAVHATGRCARRHALLEWRHVQRHRQSPADVRAVADTSGHGVCHRNGPYGLRVAITTCADQRRGRLGASSRYQEGSSTIPCGRARWRSWCSTRARTRPTTRRCMPGSEPSTPIAPQQPTWPADQLRQDHIRNAPFRVVIAHIPLYSTRDTQPHGGADARAKWHTHLADERRRPADHRAHAPARLDGTRCDAPVRSVHRWRPKAAGSDVDSRRGRRAGAQSPNVHALDGTSDQ